MLSKRFYFPWLAPLYRRVPFARFLLWQSRFLTEEGLRKLALELLPEVAEEITFVRDGTRWTMDVRDEMTAVLFMYPDWMRSNEEAVLGWMRAHGRLQRTAILEIGANIGTSTVPLLVALRVEKVWSLPLPA